MNNMRLESCICFQMKMKHLKHCFGAVYKFYVKKLYKCLCFIDAKGGAIIGIMSSV